jgi:glycine cleavage system H protein
MQKGKGCRMASLRYTKDHEWIRLDGDVGTVGISDYAQTQLGDVVFVELPPVGKIFGKGEEAAVVESVKAASEVYAPVAGEVIAVNSDLEDAPATVNEDAEGKGWFLKLKVTDAAEIDALMTEEQYKAFLETIQ